MKNGGLKNNYFTSAVVLIMDVLIMLLVVFGVFRLFGKDMQADMYYGFLKTVVVFIVCNVLSAVFLNLYNISFKGSSEIAACEFIANMISGFFALTYALISRSVDFSAGNVYMLPALVAFTAAAMALWRVLLNRVMMKLRRKTLLLVVESKREDIDLAKKIKYANQGWFDTWYISVDPDSRETVNDIINEEYPKYDGILITQKVPEAIKKRLIDEAIEQKKDLYVVPNLYEIYITKYQLMQFDDTLAFLVRPFSLTMRQRVVKRFFDIILSLAGIVIASPIMLAAAIAIKLDSKGKVIYSQERVTFNKKKFNIYKFRTMVENAEMLSGPKLATENDDRITRVGRYLRKYRLDELPQLFNILKGDMSIVGPRPERSVFVDRFCEEYPDYDKRFIVKAGLTGYAQTYGRYDTDVRDKLLYDLLYIREYSIILDLKIIFLTVKTVLMHNN